MNKSKKRYKIFFKGVLLLVGFWGGSPKAQSGRWQQKVSYSMHIDMDVSTNKFAGNQRLEYTNNSTDKLNKVFYHLYYNAFQPNSSMDNRSREWGKVLINGNPDWDIRIRDRIQNLKPDEIGYQKVISLKMNGVSQPFKYHETILEVNLTKPIQPKSKVVFEMQFEAQVPLQVRRTGRDNPQNGVRYSMSQWYPKMCEYDFQGWHPTPYVAQEFYGVWGDFDVTINIDKNYKLGGTGILVNSNEIGWGYDTPGSELKPTTSAKRNWHFTGKNIHDFVWCADPDYSHIVKKTYQGGPTFHVIYRNTARDPQTDASWMSVADAGVAVLPFIEKNFGRYAYPQYSFIHGGDGGMEYPMATLLAVPSITAAIHEWLHSWYQMMLASNESKYAWMDEGFASFAEDAVFKFYYKRTSLDNYRAALLNSPDNRSLKELIEILPEQHSGAYDNYFTLVKSGLEEPMNTHSDHFASYFPYSISSYYKGEVFLEQLGYIIGASTRDRLLLEYYENWKFKHPNPDDFIKLAEDVSGLQLDWYQEYWINSTKTIDYAIDSLWEEKGVSKIRLKRVGLMPMPIDVQVTLGNGNIQNHTIPLNLMVGNKQNENPSQKLFIQDEWRWTHRTYVLEIASRLTDIKKVEIDPSKRMADVARKNNVLELKW